MYPLVHVVAVFIYPFPHRSLLRVHFRANDVWRDAIAVIQHVFSEHPFQGELLPSFFRGGEVAFFLRQPAQRHDDTARGIAPGATRFAGHALSAVPDGFRLQQVFQRLFVLALHRFHHHARVVVVELRRRADSRAHAAVHAAVQAFDVMNVFFQFFR